MSPHSDASLTERFRRGDVYPHSFRSTTKQKVLDRFRNSDGDIVNPETGEVIPVDQVTIEHLQSVAEHWNNEGYNQTRKERADWYNNVDNLSVLPRSVNSSRGALNGQTMRQDVGPKFRK